MCQLNNSGVSCFSMKKELSKSAGKARKSKSVLTKKLQDEAVEALRLCHQALRDHVQYEDDEEGSLEGDGFRAADAVLKKIDAA